MRSWSNQQGDCLGYFDASHIQILTPMELSMSNTATIAGSTDAKGTDDNGVPLLHKDPIRHFERVLVFLAYRDVFTKEEMAISDKPGLLAVHKKVIGRIEQFFASREYLTPATSQKRLREVLMALFKNGEFCANSAIRATYSDITQHQIWTQDPSIKHRLPPCPHPATDGQFLEPAKLAKQRKKEKQAHIAGM